MRPLDAVRPAGSPILVGGTAVAAPPDDEAAESARRKFPTRPSHLVDWDAVAERYADLVYSIPLRRGIDRHDVEEIFQNTWIVALSKADVPEDAGMAGWLAAIAWWKTRAFLAGRREHASVDDLTDKVGDGGQLEPGEILSNAEEEQKVRDALQKLRPRERLLLLELFATEPPRNHAEIAATLGVSAGSIGTFRQRALDKLAELVAA
jgi:RNA polymerase sigma factor (sigma-70 family)